MDTTIPTWGYRPDGEAKIFDLEPGAALPDGWSPSPDVITDPSFATAEAVTASAAGRAYTPPAEMAPDSDDASPTSELEAAVAENERLQAIIAAGIEENGKLIAEIEAAEAALDKATDDMVALQAVLAAAETDKTSAIAAADALKAELDAARADLDAATAPKTAATDAKPKAK